MATRRSRSGDRERLSRDTIVAGAVALADAEGLDAVTIRRIANDHQVTPMALYWHFKDKGELLDGIAERLFADVRLPAPSPKPWPEQLRSVLEALSDALRPHPEVAGLVADRAACAAFSQRRILRQRPGRVPEPGRLLQPRNRHADRRRHRHHGPRFS